LEKYPRVLGIKVYVTGSEPGTTRPVASTDAKEVGQPGSSTELSVLTRNETFFGKDKGIVSVIMPLRDRNGDPMAAVRVVLRSFPGQTEANAIARATPVVKTIQAGARSIEDLVD
jgi:hypothetical protein